MGYIARRNTEAVHRKSDGMIVGPEHTEEWTEYQNWLAAGNKTDEPPPEEDNEIVKYPSVFELQKQIDDLKSIIEKLEKIKK